MREMFSSQSITVTVHNLAKIAIQGEGRKISKSSKDSDNRLKIRTLKYLSMPMP